MTQPLAVIAPQVSAKSLGASTMPPIFRMSVQAKIVLDALVPGSVVEGAPVDPLFIRHGGTPSEKRHRIGAHGMPELPRFAVNDLANLFRDQGRRCRILEGRPKHTGKASTLRVVRLAGRCLDAPRHGGIDNARLEDRDPNVEGFHLLG